ncbi:MAG: hypothetical protein ACI9U2_004927 [Bradymonadia bacterium]|jgi:hypothetical protein
MPAGDLPSTDGLINPDEDLLKGIADLCEHRGIERGMALLVGALRGATVRPGPDATPVILTAPTWLVQATATIDNGNVALHGVVSWVDQGLPRMVAGQVEAARSGGVRVQLLPAALSMGAVAAPAVTAKPAASALRATPGARPKAIGRRPAARSKPTRSTPTVPTPTVPMPTVPTPTASTAATSARDDNPHIDLSDTAAEIVPKPAPKPGGGWGAAVAASKNAGALQRAPRSTEPTARSAAVSPQTTLSPAAGTTGGWGAAVAASRTVGRGGSPSPDELGFDATPTLVTGDVLLHPRFGRCVVSRMIAKSKVKLRRPSGGLFDMHLKVCSFVREPNEGDARVFSVTIGR